MQLITNKISTGKAGRFEDFIKNFRNSQIKTASVKTAEEQEEGESSGQLDVEPLHQEGESTTMPKAGPSAKKDDGEKAAAADTNPEKEGKDSGQPKAEGPEKFTNDPKVPTKEEKGGAAEQKTKVARNQDGTGPDGKGPKTGRGCGKCNCDPCECEDKDTKTAALEDLPQEVQDKINGKKTDCDGDSDGSTGEDCKEEKEASKATQFVKWANLDSKNKSFLTTYWRQLFGDDYVNALVADK